jgi:hypothetical protein
MPKRGHMSSDQKRRREFAKVAKREKKLARRARLRDRK